MENEVHITVEIPPVKEKKLSIRSVTDLLLDPVVISELPPICPN